MRKLILICFAIVSVVTVNAQIARKYSNEFLSIGVGARGLAMSSSVGASVDDVTAGYWNPAGLTHITNNFQVGIMHAEYFAGIAKFDYGSFAIPMKDKKRVIGFTLIRFAVDDIPNTLNLLSPMAQSIMIISSHFRWAIILFSFLMHRNCL